MHEASMEGSLHFICMDWRHISILGAANGSRAAQVSKGSTPTDGYFLSKENPIANSDQRYLEKLAIELFERPDVKAYRVRTSAEFAVVTSNTVYASLSS